MDSSKTNGSKRSMTGLTRRNFLRTSSLALASAPLLNSVLGTTGLAAQRTVGFASYGGSFNDAFRAAYLKGFEPKAGITVDLGSGASLALAKLQVANSNPQWDIVELTGPEYELAVRDNMLLPLGNSVDKTNIAPMYAKPYGIKYAIFMFLMAYDQRKIADADAPKTWKDFWDTKRYPGRRSLYSNIGDGAILEAALLADGVEMKDLYPLDVDRALASLDKLGKDNIVWHTTNAEPIQQLVNGEVTLATTWLGRATRAIRSGAKIGLNPHYGAITGDYMAIMKTSQHQKEALELINYVAADVDANAEFVKLSNNAVPNTAVLPKLPPETANTLPTSPELAPTVFEKSDAWWAENLEKTQVKFKTWQLT